MIEIVEKNVKNICKILALSFKDNCSTLFKVDKFKRGFDSDPVETIRDSMVLILDGISEHVRHA